MDLGVWRSAQFNDFSISIVLMPSLAKIIGLSKIFFVVYSVKSADNHMLYLAMISQSKIVNVCKIFFFVTQ